MAADSVINIPASSLEKFATELTSSSWNAIVSLMPGTISEIKIEWAVMRTSERGASPVVAGRQS